MLAKRKKIGYNDNVEHHADFWDSWRHTPEVHVMTDFPPRFRTFLSEISISRARRGILSHRRFVCAVPPRGKKQKGRIGK